MPIAKNQDLMYEVIENMKSMARVIDEKENIVYMNRSMREEFGDKTGEKCYVMVCRNKHCEDCISKKCLKTKEAESKEMDMGDKYYQVIASPANLKAKERYAIEIFYDITEQKELEEEASRHYSKLKADVNFAKQVQRKTLPENKTYWNALRISSAYVPSEDLGGDLYDIVRLDDQRILFYIADVSGHGVQASMLTMFLRQVIRGMKAQAADLTAVLDELIRSYKDLTVAKEQYISLLCGVYNTETRGLSLINAGHNCPPLVVECGKSSCKTTEIQISGMPICTLLNEPNHEIITLQMEKGDRILLYTDGLTEANNVRAGKHFGLEGLLEVIGPNAKREGAWLASNLVLAAKRFSDDTCIDDMAVMVIEIL